jgi:hypothetical protein
MRKNKARIIASILIMVLSVALIATGFVGMGQRDKAQGEAIVSQMRTRAVLIATGEGAVESYVKIAADKARAEAKDAGLGMSGISEAVAKAEEEARANSSASMIDYATVNTAELDAALEELSVALNAYYAEEATAKNAYVEQMKALCMRADIMVPNITEAAMFAGISYQDNFRIDSQGLLNDFLIWYEPFIVIVDHFLFFLCAHNIYMVLSLVTHPLGLKFLTSATKVSAAGLNKFLRTLHIFINVTDAGLRIFNLRSHSLEFLNCL